MAISRTTSLDNPYTYTASHDDSGVIMIIFFLKPPSDAFDVLKYQLCSVLLSLLPLVPRSALLSLALSFSNFTPQQIHVIIIIIIALQKSKAMIIQSS